MYETDVSGGSNSQLVGVGSVRQAQHDVGQVAPVRARPLGDVPDAQLHQWAHLLTDVVPQHGLVLLRAKLWIGHNTIGEGSKLKMKSSRFWRFKNKKLSRQFTRFSRSLIRPTSLTTSLILNLSRIWRLLENFWSRLYRSPFRALVRRR